MDVKDPAVNWLLDSGDPSIRYLTLTDVLGQPSDSKEVLTAKKQIPNGLLTKTKLNVSNVEVVEWGRKGPNKMITLNTLRVLNAARQLDFYS